MEGVVEIANYIKKVVMLGDPAVGKTSLVRRFVKDIFKDEYISTLGAKPSKKEVNVDGENVTMMIWDIAGDNPIPTNPGYYSGAAGALVVCDLTREKTLQSVSWWISNLKNEVGDLPVKVLANKSDLTGPKYDLDDIPSYDLEPSITSAKSGKNVEESFKELAEAMIDG